MDVAAVQCSNCIFEIRPKFWLFANLGGDRISSSGQDDLICVKRVQREYEEHMTEISEYKLLVDHSCLHRTIFIHFDIVSLDH